MTTLPNILTVIRLCLSPVFIAFFITERPWAAICALGVAAVFEATDLLDGYIARRYQMVSALGKLIDPLADSVSRFSVFLAFTTEATVREHPWPVLLAAAIFYRDAIVAYVRTFAASSGTVLAARPSGKLKAACQSVGILTFLSARAVSFYTPSVATYLPHLFYGLMLPIVVVTVWSGWDYLRSNWGAIAAMARAETGGKG